jgi:hypothetical protein
MANTNPNSPANGPSLRIPIHGHPQTTTLYLLPPLSFSFHTPKKIPLLRHLGPLPVRNTESQGGSK